MKIEIKRTKQTRKAVTGTLHIDGQYICDTAENQLTALPAGEYRIVRHYCKHYERFMPLVVKPSARTVKQSATCMRCVALKQAGINTILPRVCPMLKPGNGVHKREDGSIILGTQIVPGCLKHPQQSYKPFAERIRKSVKRKTVITLTIEEQ